jgi:predicted metalloprotease
MVKIRKRDSDLVVDNRGRGRGGGGGLGGLPINLPMAAGGLSLPIILIIVVVALVTGGGGGLGIDSPYGGFPAAPAADNNGEVFVPQDDTEELVAFVIEDTQEVWATIFAQAGQQYRDAKLVLFEQQVQSGCGAASSATGPFYCPADERVYIDLGFFRELSSRFGAPGDFAQAYVIAHEVGHHVQNLTGTNEEVRRAQQRDPDKANELSVALELQADCFAGVWAHTTYERDLLESGDLEEGLTAAAAVGDDRLQREAGARVNPETWTHGSSEQRVEWFRTGFESGKPSACDTFD